RRALEWEGLPLARVALPIVRDTIRRTLPVATLFQEAAFRALDALAPRAVVITSNRRYAERALALAARARGVPCLFFSGTLLMSHDRYEFLDVADRLLVIGRTCVTVSCASRASRRTRSPSSAIRARTRR